MPKCEEFEQWILLLTGLSMYLECCLGKNGFILIPLLIRLLCVLDSDTANERNGKVERVNDKGIQ